MEKFKMPMKEFEKLVIKKNEGTKGLSTDDFGEMNEKGKMIRTTFYYKNNKHIASWNSGNGWFL